MRSPARVLRAVLLVCAGCGNPVMVGTVPASSTCTLCGEWNSAEEE